VAEQVLATHLTLAAGQPVVNVFGSVYSPQQGRWLTEEPAFGHLWNIKRLAAKPAVVVFFRSICQALYRDYGVDRQRLRAILATV
jgi:hypothetical protein